MIISSLNDLNDFNIDLIFLDQIQLKKLYKLTKEKSILMYNRYNSHKLYTIEKIFNIKDYKLLSNILYQDNPYQYYKNSVDYLSKIFFMNIGKFKSINQRYLEKTQIKVVKYLGYKLKEDYDFHKMDIRGYSHAFTMLENRKDRLIYMLDINSSYPYLMTKKIYPDPRKLIRSNSNRLLSDILSNKINNGIFKTLLTIKDVNEPFLEYLPFYKDKIPYDLKSNNNSINTYLSANEIKFYIKFFDIEVISGTYSKESIYHPLKRRSEYFYKLKEDSVSVDRDIAKSILVSLNSFLRQNRSVKESYRCNNIDELSIMIKDKYDIDIDNSKMFKIVNIKTYSDCIKYSYKFRSYNLDNNILSVANTLYNQAKLELLEYWYKIYKSDQNYRLCYSNIDSLHISIPKNSEEDFLNVIKDRFNNKIGSFKCEGKGVRGVWLDVGKYKIVDGNSKTVKFTTSLPYNSNKTKVSIREFDKYGNEFYVTYSMFKNISIKSLINRISDDYIVFDKCKYDKISDGYMRGLIIRQWDIYKEVWGKI
jgi:hypothetical protein